MGLYGSDNEEPSTSERIGNAALIRSVSGSQELSDFYSSASKPAGQQNLGDEATVVGGLAKGGLLGMAALLLARR